ncbi:MAG: Nif3-like dinuclear metal center hexameric protein [Sedimentisphaerales bacterium]|nr:Nif3-like dinuclear metal center hexameric protein [Sedimentisphaerales bacterium]
MKIKDIAEKINEVVPLKMALDWDNVGLLIGDPKKDVKNILLTIDTTKEVLAEAKREKIDLIISYHPVIWDGLKKITTDDSTCVVYELIRSNIAVYSIHTALDILTGGVNDGLAEIIGITNAKPIGDYIEYPDGDNYKLVVFVPAASLAKVSNAVFAAGAGAIGNYSNCGFGADGTGTFMPLDGAKPAIGKKNKLEKVHEIRFETIVPAKILDAVIAAMKKAHPYEMPAYDVIKLYNENKLGLGRIGLLEKPSKISELIKKIKRATGAKAVGLVGDEKKLVKKAAVCAGTCGKIINSIIAQKADLYLTGELKHHQALAAQEANLTCICLSHTVSERFILKKLAKQLQKQLKGTIIKISKKDSDPFRWMNI